MLQGSLRPALLASLGLCVLWPAAAAHARHDAEILVHLTFEGDVTDHSAAGNHGSLVGTSGNYIPSSIHGKPGLGQALSLDGINDLVNLNAVADDLAGGHDFSLAVWIRTASPGTILSVQGPSAIEKLTLYVNGTGHAEVSQGGLPIATSTTTVGDDEWRHVAIAFDGGSSTGLLYVDGNLEQAFGPTPTALFADDTWSLGGPVGQPLGGLIDDARLFEGVLDAADIAGIKGHPDNPAKESEHTLLFKLVPEEDATHATIASGAWSDSSIWESGAIPASGARALIASGTSVQYDVDNVTEELFWLRVDGELHFDPTIDTTLRVDTMVVDTKGTLTIGTESAPIQPDRTARIVFNSDGDIDRSWDPIEISRGLITHGRFQAHGAIKTPFGELPQALAGESSITLDDVPLGWRVGDTLVLAGTFATYAGDDDQNTRFHDEILEITSIQGATIGFRNRTNQAAIASDLQSLLWDHAPPAGYDLRIHVANLTRNVVLETEDFASLSAPEDVKRRGHVMLMHNDDADVRYVASIGNGRTNKSLLLNDSILANGSLIPGTGSNQRGRYALHLHRLGPNKPTPVQIIGNAIWTSPGWGLVHHDSHADVTDNVAFDVDGAAFVLEDGSERGSLRRNLAIKNRGDGDPDMDIEISPRTPIFDLGFNGHGFWIQGGGGPEVTDNISASAYGTAFFVHSNDDLLPGPNHPNVLTGLLEPQPVLFPTEHLAYPDIAAGADAVSVAAVPLRRLSGMIAYNANRGLMTWMHMRNDDGVGGFSLTEAAQYPHQRGSIIEDFQFFALRLTGINYSYTSQTHYRNGLILGDPSDQFPGEGWPADRLENGYAFPQGLVRTAVIGNMAAGEQLTFENLRVEGWPLGLMVPHTGPPITTDDDVNYVASSLLGGHFDRNGQHLFPQTTGYSTSQQAFWTRSFTPFFQLDGQPFFGPVAGNQDPTATWSGTSVGGFAIEFDAGQSFDPDGPAPGGLGVDAGNGIATYTWDFGDGSPVGFGRSVRHVYEAPGSYPVVLSVRDKQGSIDVHGQSVEVSTDDYPNLIQRGDFSDTTPFPSYPQWQFADGNALPGGFGNDWVTTENSPIQRVGGRAQVTGSIGASPPQRRFIHQLLQDDRVRRGTQQLRFDAINTGPGAAGTSFEILIHGVNGEFRLPYLPDSAPTPWNNGDGAFQSTTLFQESFGGLAFDESFVRDVDFGAGYQFVVVTFLIGNVNPATGAVVAIDNVEISTAATAQTVLSSLFALPLPTAATLHWSTITEGSVASYRVEVAEGSPAAFALVANLPAVGGPGPNDYELTANGLMPSTPHWLRLIEVRQDLSEVTLGTLSVTPTTPGTPSNVLTVGNPGGYATIQAAVNAAIAEGAVIQVFPGSYPAFSIGWVPEGGLRIVGMGDVLIDTSVMPLTIHDLPPDSFVQLQGLTIGNEVSPHQAVVVRDSQGLVLLDQIVATTGPNQDAIHAERSTQVVLQRSTLLAESGASLRVEQSSIATASNTLAQTVEVALQSHLTTCAVAGEPPSVDATSTLDGLTGMMPELDTLPVASIATSLPISFSAEPNVSWILVASDGFRQQALANVEMPLLIDLGALQTLATRTTNGVGADSFALFIPPWAALVGQTFSFQGARLGPTAIRMSNVEGLTLLP